MTEEPWNKHTPGDPMPCKCGQSVVDVKFCDGGMITEPAKYRNWDKIKGDTGCEITDWRFVERKGDDVIAADPYAALSQHLHGDGDAPQAADTCSTPGCPHPSVIRLNDRRLCRNCYAIHDFGDNA